MNETSPCKAARFCFAYGVTPLWVIGTICYNGNEDAMHFQTNSKNKTASKEEKTHA
jgi:hypothetical protein